MHFPFSIKTALNWLDFVPSYLISLENTQFVYNKEFHQYIGSKLENFFLEAPSDFFSAINSILSSGTEYGKYIMIEALISAKAIWKNLSNGYNLQPILLEMALSPDKIYTKSAVQLSSYLEESVLPKKDEESLRDRRRDILGFKDSISRQDLDDEIPEMKKEGVFSPESEIEDDDDFESEEESFSAPPPAPAGIASRSASLKSPPPSPAKQVPISEKEISFPKPKRPSTPMPSPIVEPSPPPPSPAPVITAASLDSVKREEPAKKRKKEKKKKLSIEPLEEYIEPAKDTLHTHVHYYSRMNPRKTYPFSVSISRIAKELKKDKVHFLSGEEEKETRGEFEAPDDLTQQLIVEPLIPGCLIQPTFQYFSPQSKNLPKELTFFVTPLIETGLRSTALNGSLFIKNDLGLVLLKLKLPSLAITTHRMSQVLATIGTIGGGALPALDFIYEGNLQTEVANQLSDSLPTIADQINMGIVLLGTQLSIFVGALGLGFLWWWKKSRAKLAPKHDLILHLPQ